jgi:hypothetical protein
MSEVTDSGATADLDDASLDLGYESDDDLYTPRIREFTFEIPIWWARLGASDPLPPLTPGLVPSLKRALSPPSAPRPAKRRKIARHVDELFDEVYSNENFPESGSDQALRHARELTLNLIETAGCSADELDAGENISVKGDTVLRPQDDPDNRGTQSK